MIRNLLYNAYCPAAWPDVWRDNIARLNRYADTFNGRKLVLIKQDASTAPPEEVRAAFRLGPDVEFRVVANHARRHEAEGFLEALETLQSTRRDEATFYAHTKGCAKGDHTHDHQQAIRQWRNRMYKECLEDVPRLERALQHSAAAGAFFRSLVEHPQHAPSKWAYAGTYYWLRHDRLFATRWREGLQDDRMGPELFPGTLLPARDAAKLYDCKAHLYYDVFSRYLCSACEALVITERTPEGCDECGDNGPLAWLGYADLLYDASGEKPRTIDLLNRLAHAYGGTSYLQIGDVPRTLSRVRMSHKRVVGLDELERLEPEPKWDLIFVAGHEHALRGMRAALRNLAPGGAIVVPGCNPGPAERENETWRAWAFLRSRRPGLQMRVVSPMGCGVIRRGKQELLELPPEQLTWERFRKERAAILNLMGWHEWLRATWLSRIQPRVRVVP